MKKAFQLILFPGLGADHRLLEPQRQAFPQLEIPPWIPPYKKETLPDYAARFAETIRPMRDRPLILGGVSFGGMMAYELARYLKPDAVVLIATCRTRRGLRPWYRASRWLLPLLPVQGWEIAKMLAGVFVSLRISVPKAQKNMAVQMFREVDSSFMHWTLQAVLNWQPTPLEGIRLLHIHGARDRVLPLRGVQPDEIIPDGGHLINMTHAEQVNRFICHGIFPNEPCCSICTTTPQ